MATAVCPGSFDPVTTGHLDIIERAAHLFTHVIVAVAVNPEKRPLFSVGERREMLAEVLGHLPNVSVESLDGLLVEFAVQRGAEVLVKGLRAISDFELEFQQALMNSHIEPRVDTVFLMTRPEHSFLSSTLIKQVASLGGTVAGLVPPSVEARLRDRLRGRSPGSP